MKLIFKSVCALVILSINLYGQVNLVPNASFEIFSSCPSFAGQINLVHNWNNVNLIGGFSVGSPDFYNTCGTTTLCSLPINAQATLNAFDGNSVVGLVIYNRDIANYREYISSQLIQPLTSKNTYQIKFHITGGSVQNYIYNTHNFGIVFSENPLTQTTWEYINEVPQIEIDTLLNTTQWVEYSFEFTPTQTLSYITIGSFRTDSQINLSQVSQNGSVYATVFIDAIEIFNLTSEGLEDKDFSNVSVFYYDQKIQIANIENESVKSLNLFDLN